MGKDESLWFHVYVAWTKSNKQSKQIKQTYRCRHQNGGYQRWGAYRKDERKGDLTHGRGRLGIGWGAHSGVYKCHIMELSTWNLFSVINQILPSINLIYKTSGFFQTSYGKRIIKIKPLQKKTQQLLIINLKQTAVLSKETDPDQLPTLCLFITTGKSRKVQYLSKVIIAESGWPEVWKPGSIFSNPCSVLWYFKGIWVRLLGKIYRNKFQFKIKSTYSDYSAAFIKYSNSWQTGFIYLGLMSWEHWSRN